MNSDKALFYEGFIGVFIFSVIVFSSKKSRGLKGTDLFAVMFRTCKKTRILVNCVSEGVR